MRPAALLKKRPWHKYFPMNFVKFLRTPLVAASATKNISKSLVLYFFLGLQKGIIGLKCINKTIDNYSGYCKILFADKLALETQSCIDMMMHIVRLTCIDLILTDSASSISNRVKFSSLLSAFQKLVVSVLKSRSHQICSVKQAIMKNFVKPQEKTYPRVSFLIKLQAMT